MIIDRESFTELTVHLKLASDAILKSGRQLAGLSSDGAAVEGRCASALGEMTALAIELMAMERILRAVMQANRDEECAPASGWVD